jgi:2-hydroxychromene-2-carboxylate isomerase
MYDRLFEARGVLGREDLVAYATELGLDADRVAAELDASAHAGRVQRDLDSGVASGVQGTPGLFVGGRFYGGSYEGSSLITVLETSS